MVAKIHRGRSLYGVLAYNRQKVERGDAHVVAGNRIAAYGWDDPERFVRQVLHGFEPYLAANRNTEKPILHISLNPTLGDRLSDEQFAALAEEYMERMGYGDQPYAVYRHEDTGRPHAHIVSVCVDERGRKISDRYEFRRSMEACRALEARYGLEPAVGRERTPELPPLQKLDPTQGRIKEQITNLLNSVYADYRFRSFGECAAVLRCCGVEAKQVRGTHNGESYCGVVYVALDRKGRAVGVPIKSSAIDRRFGAVGLAQRIERHAAAYARGAWRPRIEPDVRRAVQGCRGDRARFERLLSERGIEAVFRRTDSGRIYGVTFVDHATKTACNGSRLGKEFSANAFERLFAPSVLDLRLRIDPQAAEESLEALFGVFSPEPARFDPQEEPMPRPKRRKKKRKITL